MGGLPSTPLPLGLAGLVIAKPAPILLTGGQRNVQATGQENPKLFPPDGLGIGAGGGIAPMGLAAALSYFVRSWVSSSWFSRLAIDPVRGALLWCAAAWVTPVGVASVASSTFDLNPGCSWLDDP